MAGRTQYKTRQYSAIVAYLAEHENEHTTIGMLEEYFRQAGTPVGTATIYRHLEKLAARGVIRKYRLDGMAGACYQYHSEKEGCDSHLHLKCEKCGRLIHLEDEDMRSFQLHIQQTHGFHTNFAKTVIYGLCNSCADDKE